MMSTPIISVRNISKRYYIEERRSRNEVTNFFDLVKLPFRALKGDIFSSRHHGTNVFWALRGISFEVQQGERLGIIGKNGAGKTTLMKILSRLVYPTEGEAILFGRTTALFGVGTGFKAKLTGKENIFYSAALHGVTKDEINKKFKEIVEFSGLERFIDSPVQYYSKGMYTRLAFSVAAHLDPDILLLDEVLSGGDMAFQKKCLEKIEGQARSGRTVLFVSHNMNAVIRLCNTCIWIEDGQIVERGDPADVVRAYSKHMLKLKSSYNTAALPPIKPADDDVPKDVRSIPGASLISFNLFSGNQEAKEVFSRDEALIAEIKFEILRDEIDIIPKLQILKGGELVFITYPPSAVKAKKGSVCISRLTIPGKLLNTGDYDFSLAIITPVFPRWKHVVLQNALSIKIVPEPDGQKIFAKDPKGYIHPDLPWTIDFEAQPEGQ